MCVCMRNVLVCVCACIHVCVFSSQCLGFTYLLYNPEPVLKL